ncbi:ribosome biogenesis GTPase Der [Elusimicrobiota bacterium]
MHKNVVIIGRPNVGKSTLFNRLVGRRRALVHDVPGTTRDRNEVLISWKDEKFVLADTAGWAVDESIFSASVQKQMEIALQKADLVLFIVDGKKGSHPMDKEINNILRKSKTNTILVINKIDTQGDETKIYDFYNLGIDNLVDISANHGRNIPELLSRILEKLSRIEDTASKLKQNPAINVILVGKPNVGKSSLVNSISKEDRSIVYDKPGTTIEAFDIVIKKDNFDFTLIDTPGLHRKRKFKDDMEYLSALSARHAMERADIAVLVIDVDQGIGETEARIGKLILEKKNGCLIVINKWDLVEEKEIAVKIIKEQIEEKLKFLSWVRILHVSAKTGQRTDKILSEVEKIYSEYSRIIPQQDLSEAFRDAVTKNPLSRHGVVLKIKEVRQTGSNPPAFSIHVNNTEIIHFSYKRYLENQIRDHFGLAGSPILLRFYRNKKD